MTKTRVKKKHKVFVNNIGQYFGTAGIIIVLVVGGGRPLLLSIGTRKYFIDFVRRSYSIRTCVTRVGWMLMVTRRCFRAFSPVLWK